MIDYLSWFLPGTTEEEALKIGTKLDKKLQRNPDVFLCGILRVTEDHLLKEMDICRKGEDWEIQDMPLERGQLCLFYRADLAGRRKTETLLQKEKNYQFTLAWTGDEISEDILQKAAMLPEEV